ncbi:hypothetical protein BaRGS_00015528, partial [Batillaria attramentaria]
HGKFTEILLTHKGKEARSPDQLSAHAIVFEQPVYKTDLNVTPLKLLQVHSAYRSQAQLLPDERERQYRAERGTPTLETEETVSRPIKSCCQTVLAPSRYSDLHPMYVNVQ